MNRSIQLLQNWNLLGCLRNWLCSISLPFQPKYYPSFSFSKEADYSLVMIGAHTGRKTRFFVERAARYGKVCLVEPVPHLFAQLIKTHAHTRNVELVNKCITAENIEKVAFYAPTEDANKIRPFGDQLGSLNPYHAVNHDRNLTGVIKEIEVPALTIHGLLSKIKCGSLNILYLDTEGYDMTLLEEFPFSDLKPCSILFEHKHADGTHNIGENFGRVITTLNKLGYRVQCLDRENCLATLR